MPASLPAQQYTLQALGLPGTDLARGRTQDIGVAYLGYRGAGAELNGLDVNMSFAVRGSSPSYAGGTLGVALLGAPGKDELRVGGETGDGTGISLHFSADKWWLGPGDIPRWGLYLGIPASFNNFTIEGIGDKEITVYTLLLGVQGGARFNLEAGPLVFSPSAMLSLMGGYRERYRGGTYWANLNSGGVGPFPVLSLGADLAHPRSAARLRVGYQRFVACAGDRAMDALSLQFSLGWGRGKRAGAGG